MGKRMVHTPGAKWHKGPDGVPRRCTASIRSCQYQDHYTTETDAKSDRQRSANGLTLTDKVKFDTQLGAVPAAAKRDEEITLRQSAEIARRNYATTGKRPQSPLGKADIWLPDGQRISLTRETYDRVNARDRIGARYVLQYFPTEDSYEESVIELNNRVEYEMLVKQIDEYFAEASDQAAMNGEDTSKLVPYYKTTLQTIAEVETMSRGADKAYRQLGVDLFNHQRPGELTLDVDYDNSTVHSYDVSDALKGHAAADKYLSMIAIHIHGEIPKVPDATWSLDRLPEGDWLVGVHSHRGVVSQRIEDADKAKRLLEAVFRGHRALPESYQEQLRYVHQSMQEIEPAINSYQAAMEAKIAERQRMMERVKEVAAEKKEEPRKGFAAKIGGLFS